MKIFFTILASLMVPTSAYTCGNYWFNENLENYYAQVHAPAVPATDDKSFRAMTPGFMASLSPSQLSVSQETKKIDQIVSPVPASNLAAVVLAKLSIIQDTTTKTIQGSGSIQNAEKK